MWSYLLKKIIFIFLLVFEAQAKLTGQIKGVVSFVDKKGNEITSKAVVYITGYEEKSSGKAYKISQKDKTFSPDILPIVKGDKVDFANSDQISHNVFSVSSARQFDLGQTSFNESKVVDFNKAGIVDVFCNIHPEMFSTVLVLPNSSFAVTDSDGNYSIKNIPIGIHKVYIWTRSGKPQSLDITVVENKTLTQNWVVTVSDSPPEHLNKHGKPYSGKSKY